MTLPLFMQRGVDYDQALRDDPYLGYSSIAEAQNDCKAASQVEVLGRLLNRESVFVSGIAGSGKSSIVNPFVNYLKQEFPEVTVSVVAPTGAAAANIGGMTFHRWGGVFVKDDKTIFANRKALADVDVLVIDEISMLPAYLFSALDKALQINKRVWKPFGGVQMVLMGDFMQLPPVPTEGQDSRFALLTDSWKKLDPVCCFIDKTRRATDTRLQKVLTDITREQVTEETRDLIESRVGLEREKDHIYVNLFTTNRKIDSYNKQKLEEIPTKSQFYHAQLQPYRATAQKAVEAEAKKLDMNRPVELKVGCPVLLTKNLYVEELLYPNGSLGTVLELHDDYVIVQFNNGDVQPIRFVESSVVENVKEKRLIRGAKKTVNVEEIVGIVRYLPLRLGYATSVHKSQGQTCDGVVADLNNIFTPGLGYVALSRVRDLDDLIISDMSEKIYDVDPVSSKITKYVKLSSLKNRREFTERSEDYHDVLTNPLTRIAIWGK